MTEKLQFNVPDEEMEAAPVARAVVSPAALAGTWYNCDSATRGIVRIVIGVSGSAITVHAYGACHPTPCDWGTAPGLAYAANVSSSAAVAFSAVYKASWKETILVGHLDQGTLIVECFTNFTDSSGRSDYYSLCYMYKK